VEIAVISDLHLGTKDRADGFGHDDGEFLRFLCFLERHFERIVLLGDIWETLTSRCPWAARHALLAARESHPEIARRLRGPRYEYIHGNHDMVARSVDGARERWLLDVDGRRLLFTHGHEHDRLFRVARHLAELGVCIGGWLRRAGFHRLYRWLDGLDQKRSAIAMDPNQCTFQAWAVDAAEKARADIVITGHTHLSLVVAHERTLYLNSGSCSQGHISFLRLDTRRDVYAVHQSW